MTAAVSVPPDFPGFEHRLVDAGSLRMHLVEGGEGDPVLLLHGWPQHFWCWRSVAPALAERFRVICPDLRGFGWTDAPAHGHDAETFAADVLALLDALELERVWVAGHDWGGFTSLLLGMRHPERVRGVLAMNTVLPWIDANPRQLPDQLRRFWYTAVVAAPVIGERLVRQPGVLPKLLEGGTVQPAISPDDAAIYAARFAEPERAKASVALYRSFLRSAFEVSTRGAYKGYRLTVPARLLLSDGDPAIAPTPQPGWESHVDDLTVELVENCGHFMPEETPELVVDRAVALFDDAYAGAGASS